MGARCIYFENKYYVTCNGGDGLSVIRIGKGVSLDSEARVYIATRGVSHERICEILNNCGITDIVPVNAELDMRLRNQFVNAYFKEMHWTFSKLDYSKALRNHDDEVDKSSVIYAVKSEADSPLATDVPLERYESFIQAGRALADEQLKECRYVDNTGNNISDRNRQMCELTAMYWIWKNADAEVVGIEHYRRRFLLPAGWSAIIQDGDADVILPVPLYVSPSIKDNYVSRHDIGPWNSMLKQIDRIYGEECLEKATGFFENTGCYSPCNMVVAQREVFDEMCRWMFPIVFNVLEECGIINDRYQNRYPGFLSERLITFFFFMNREKFKVVYADKTFIK